MTVTAKERLRRFYAQFSGDDHVLIPIVADPDAIASAMAVKRLLWRRVAGVTIANVNVVQRTDNLVLIRLIGVTMIPFEKIDPARFNRVVLVDAQPDHHERLADLEPQVIIDHHPLGERSQAPFADIRPKYGATASIMIEYLRAAKIKPSTRLATALYFAIKTDTSDFERHTGIEDLQAFQFVFHLSNIALARRIECAEIRLDFLKYFKRALDEMHLRKGRVFVHLGRGEPSGCVRADRRFFPAHRFGQLEHRLGRVPAQTGGDLPQRRHPHRCRQGGQAEFRQVGLGRRAQKRGPGRSAPGGPGSGD